MTATRIEIDNNEYVICGISDEKNVSPFSQSEIDAITGGNAVEDIEPYCDDYLWK